MDDEDNTQANEVLQDAPDELFYLADKNWNLYQIFYSMIVLLLSIVSSTRISIKGRRCYGYRNQKSPSNVTRSGYTRVSYEWIETK